MEVQEQEVDFGAVKEEDGTETKTTTDQAPVPSAEPETTAEVLEALAPKTQPVIRKIGVDPDVREYTQRPLAFVAKIQFFSVVGDVMDKALSGDNAMTVGHLFEAPEMRAGSLRAEDFRDADTFVQAVAKLVKYSPTFMLDCYCIWLAVPDFEQEWAKEVMALPEDEGGLSDEVGVDIIETFIDQNWEALETFFRERIGKIQKRIQSHTEEADQEDGSPQPPSKRSSTSARTTRKS